MFLGEMRRREASGGGNKTKVSPALPDRRRLLVRRDYDELGGNRARGLLALQDRRRLLVRRNHTYERVRRLSDERLVKKGLK
jgi:hypothetical protein